MYCNAAAQQCIPLGLLYMSRQMKANQDPSVLMDVQDSSWVIGEELGRGANCVVYAATNPFWPGVVLKKGLRHVIQSEADFIWQLDHPARVRIFCVVNTPELDGAGQPLAYLAMERLGPIWPPSSTPTSSEPFQPSFELFLCVKPAATLPLIRGMQF